MIAVFADSILSCANCGKGGEGGGDGIQLKVCTACKLVKYCNRECQIAHRPQHKKECKKRAAELHDKLLFKQPPTEDCPICFIRMASLDTAKKYKACCGKVICSGCIHAVALRTKKTDAPLCPFCRTPTPDKDEKANEMELKQVEKNDAKVVVILGDYVAIHRTTRRQSNIGIGQRSLAMPDHITT